MGGKTASVETAIETDKLTCTFGNRPAVDGLTLTIPTGTVFGFLGPNGAGKTTTVRMLTTLITPTSGTARIAGHTLGADDDAIRRSVGILTETPGLYDKLNAVQNLTFFARLYGLSAQRTHTQIEHYLRLMELWERRDEPVVLFSKGMRQKLAIVRALLHEPPVVFLDEPTAGLDPEIARTVRESIKALRAEGRTIFLTTHNLWEAEELCDQIAVFRTHLLRVDSPEHLRTALFGQRTHIQVVGDAAPWHETVKSLAFVQEVTSTGDTLHVTTTKGDADNPALIAALVGAGAQIRYVKPTDRSLEDVYMELVREP